MKWSIGYFVFVAPVAKTEINFETHQQFHLYSEKTRQGKLQFSRDDAQFLANDFNSLYRHEHKFAVFF